MVSGPAYADMPHPNLLHGPGPPAPAHLRREVTLCDTHRTDDHLSVTIWSQRGLLPFTGFASTPASLRCSGVMGAGAAVSGSNPPPDLGKAMTSRIDSVPASRATIRSQPKAMPPCGGAPYLNASRRKPNFS